MNIMFHCSEYPPYKNGGIGSVTKIVAEALAARGHKVIVVGAYPNLNSPCVEDFINGVRVIRLRVSVLKGINRNIYLYLNKLRLIKPFIQHELSEYEYICRKIIKENNIQIFELTDYYEFNKYNCKLKYSVFSIPVVMRVHGSVSFMKRLSNKKHDYADYNDKLHFSRCNYLSSVSRFSQTYVERNFTSVVFKEKRVIYNPIEKSFLKDNLPSTSKTILYIGRLNEGKGAYNLIKAFSLFHKDFPEWTLKMIGGGDINKILSLIAEYSVQNVKIMGYCSREQIQKEIDASSFACIPTQFENFSMVALEIMARKRCLVYTNTTSGPETIISDVDGLTINPYDIHDIYSAMKELVLNVDKRNRLASASYEKIKNKFTTNNIIGEIEEYYKNIIDDL